MSNLLLRRQRRQATDTSQTTKSHSKWVIIDQETTLLEALSLKLYPEMSKRDIKRGIEGKGCLISGTPETFANKKLPKGARIEVFEEAFSAPEPTLNRIIFEDAHIIVYDKPAGYICTDPMQVHRLDKETSGLYMVAKTSEMFRAMCELFKKRGVQKKYVAVVAYRVKEKGGRIDSRMRVKKKLQGQKVWESGRQGLFARTDWKLIGIEGPFSRLSIEPTTGRTHQIRVHMAEMGHPIIGDYQYGRAFPRHVLRQLLHAESLTFVHPMTQKRITLHSKAPF